MPRCSARRDRPQRRSSSRRSSTRAGSSRSRRTRSSRRTSEVDRQVTPPSITGKGAGFAEGGSVLDHAFGKGEPFTLGVEEEYMLLDEDTFDLVQHVDTVL